MVAVILYIGTDFLDCANAELSCSTAGWKKNHTGSQPQNFDITIVFIQHQKGISWSDI
jgi:hypothetical protein